MQALLGLVFLCGGAWSPIYYVRCLVRGEFPGGRRRAYVPIDRHEEPIRFWLCAVIFGGGALSGMLLGIGLGLRLLFSPE